MLCSTCHDLISYLEGMGGKKIPGKKAHFQVVTETYMVVILVCGYRKDCVSILSNKNMYLHKPSKNGYSYYHS